MATLGGNLLQRTRCAYFRDPQYPCNKRAPGSGCSAIDGVNRGHALLGISEHCIAVYPGDWAIALVALDASIDTFSPRGTRTIRVADIHRAAGRHPADRDTMLAPDEMIVRTRVPATPLGKASTYLKIRDRESYAFALASAAVALSWTAIRVREARIALGGVATAPMARSRGRAEPGRPNTRRTQPRNGPASSPSRAPEHARRTRSACRSG